MASVLVQDRELMSMTMTDEALDTPDTDDGLPSRYLTEDELTDLTEQIPAPASITYSTQDFDVAGLVRRLNEGAILIPSFGEKDGRITTAGFQRGFVWTKRQMDRFIESLLLGYPVPGIFLVRQTVNNRHLVLDGQQRLETLRRFYQGLHASRAFVLDNVSDQFKGRSYSSLDEAARFRLDDSFLRATIVASDGSAEVNEAVYNIFERLNSGGTQLTPHEIRVALYAGPFVQTLEDLNQDAAWRELYGKPSPRIRDQELILRIIALYMQRAAYARPLKSFLNKFMSDNRLGSSEVDAAGELFARAAEVILGQLGSPALRRGSGQVNGAQTEAVFVAVMEAMRDGSLLEDLRPALSRIVSDDDFAQATTRATADNDAVEQRLRVAHAAFSDRR